MSALQWRRKRGFTTGRQCNHAHAAHALLDTATKLWLVGAVLITVVLGIECLVL